MMNPTTRVYVFLLGLAVLAFVINLVRTRRLQERYALLWILAGAAITIGPLVIPWIDRLAYALGFDYPPALLLMLTSIGLMLIILQLSLSISRNVEHLKVLTQEIALMRQELDALKTTVPHADAIPRADLGAASENTQGMT
jgi:hypothetical protein